MTLEAVSQYTLAQVLADFTTKLRPEDIPSPVWDKARLHLLDTLGVMLLNYPADFAPTVYEMAAEMGGRQEATVAGFGSRLPAALAALVNGTLAHGNDYDDTDSRTQAHPGGAVMATALAMGERQRADGASMLAAAIAGYEVALRVGSGAPTAFDKQGFHTTPICGSFGAAATAGKLLGLDADRLTNALGIVGSQAAGLGEFKTDGSWVKRLHAGWAAHSGIMAALLAERGFTGPARVLEGQFGLFRTHAVSVPFEGERVTRGLGSDWAISQVSLKLHTCCHYIHGSLEAMLEVREKHHLRPEEVREIVCYVPEQAVLWVCEPREFKLKPPTSYAAKFSIAYAVAAALVEGHGQEALFDQDKIRDPRILEVVQRVRYEVDPETLFPAAFGGAVDVVLRDGRTLHQRVPACKGSPGNLAPEDVIAKFMDNVEGILTPEAARQLVEMVTRVETLPELSKLAALLRGEDSLARETG